jgi:hypothetical protein|tara:strand:- start:12628 stop:13095 length:468 start_codon:yes stop_codon:yes gene_type:complete
MVKIVELDETETTGLASAGIGLAGSELPNKRKKKKTTRPPLEPLGGLKGIGGGGGGGGKGSDVPGEDANGGSEPSEVEEPSIGKHSQEPPKEERGDMHQSETETQPTIPPAAMVILGLIVGIAIAVFAFVVAKTLAGLFITPFDEDSVFEYGKEF